MRHVHDHSTICKEYRDSLFGIIYPVICIICALFLVWRIRNRQRARYTLLGARMDAPSKKGGGDQSSGATSEGFSHLTNTALNFAPLPSACDILQPLSHSSPLPPSGYLAAVLSERRRNDSQPQRSNEFAQPTTPQTPPWPSTITRRTDHSPPLGNESSPTQIDDLSPATFPPISRNAEENDRDLPRSPESGVIQSVQKRSEQVQLLHEADEQGVRTWRRWVIEYS
ncbi:uncharacterized protein BDV14DRAFT_147992 [Aspergillus stella-maris]|uniref:uncharacterized protein n=1 Tax=Aspergillus stella-maris TaxID=1810926 RepID=UPI003CCE0212